MVVLCSATKDTTVVLSAPITMGLDDCLEYCGQDELVEVTGLLPSLHPQLWMTAAVADCVVHCRSLMCRLHQAMCDCARTLP